MMDWLLRNARVADDAPLVDMGIHAGTIHTLAPAGAAFTSGEAHATWDLAGRVVLPGLVDAHTHLDKTYLSKQNNSGTLTEAIEIWRAAKADRTPEKVRAAATRALMRASANGVVAMRTHVDTEDRADLEVLETVLALRDEFADMLKLQVVALGNPAGTAEQRTTMAAAISLGADLVGGAPVIYPDPHACIDAAFALAERHGKPIDLHIDETEDPTILTLAYLAERTQALGMQGAVTAGHCCSLGFVDEQTAATIIERVAAAKLNIVTLPSCNLVLMGRGRRPVPRGITPVKALRARGVRVCAASDNVQDPFNPFGSYDPLQMAHLNAHVAHMSGEDELQDALAMVTTHAAAVLGLEHGGVAPDSRADLVVLDTDRVLDAVLSPPPRLATFVGGRLITRAEVSRIWPGAPTTALPDSAA